MAVPPPTRCSVKISKSFSYEGGTKVWSNRYFFSGSSPTNTQFQNLTDALKALEQPCYTSAVSFVDAVGYFAGSDVPVWSNGMSGNGNLTPATGRIRCPGDCVGVVRFATDQRTTKNHPIYLFKYYHGVWAQQNSQPDNVGDDFYAAYDALGAALVSGTSDGTTTRDLVGPRGATAQDHTITAWVRHRDFPR